MPLTHFDKNGAAHMVDVGQKEPSRRTAVAVGAISMNRECFLAVESGTAKKGDVLLNELLKRGIISASGSTVAAAGFSAQYSDEHSDMRQTMIKTYAAAGFEAPSTDEVMAQFKDKKQAKQVLSDLFKDGTLVKLNPGAYLYKDHYEKAMELLRGHFVSHDTMSLAEFRDMLGTSRKYVLLILDHLDQQKITKLQGDVRVLLK